MILYPTETWKKLLGDVEELMCAVAEGENREYPVLSMLDDLRERMLNYALIEKDGVCVDAAGEA